MIIVRNRCYTFAFFVHEQQTFHTPNASVTWPLYYRDEFIDSVAVRAMIGCCCCCVRAWVTWHFACVCDRITVSLNVVGAWCRHRASSKSSSSLPTSPRRPPSSPEAGHAIVTLTNACGPRRHHRNSASSRWREQGNERLSECPTNGLDPPRRRRLPCACTRGCGTLRLLPWWRSAARVAVGSGSCSHRAARPSNETING